MTRLTALTVLSFALVACGGSTPAPQTPAPTPASTKAEAKAPGEAKIGDHSKCPVSGEEFVVDASSPHAEYNGKTYYFCCGGCLKKFQADPAKYTNKT
jgi:YHS domain-containing protein